MQRRKVFGVLGLAGLGVGFALFRPDTLFWSVKVNESFPGASTAAGGGNVLLTGRFHGVAHETSGTATILRTAEGGRVLRLADFKTSNGPDVRVVLGKAADASDNDAVKTAGFVEVANLKGNVGDQNYDLPADLDLSAFKSVTIWCNRFSANFGTAPLSPPGMGGAAKVLATGKFHGVAHDTSGTATILQTAEGKRVLRLTGFATSNGPDVRVRLAKAADATDTESVKTAGSIEVAPLKGNVGDLNYDLSDDLDLAAYKSVVIWCNRFSVNFGTAPLASGN